jgi:putative ATP-dependent endonuclease of OLD family
MLVSRVSIENFRGIRKAEIEFSGHTLLIGGNNVGKSTICEALELALSPDRQARFPVVEEFDFYNAAYLDDDDNTIDIRIEVLLTDVTPTVRKSCQPYLERWNPKERKLLGQGEIDGVDEEGLQWALRLLTIARYNSEEDEFQANTHYAVAYNPDDEDDSRVSRPIKRTFGFLYLRALRTGSRALSLERGSLLDLILRIQSLQTGIWEHVRGRLEDLTPPIDDGAKKLTPVLHRIEQRLADYIPMAKPGEATRLFVSQLTREHLRKTLSFFLSIAPDQKPVPFQEVGTGTLNTLVLALLSFIAELKEENVIFAMEEPEIALPPHTQRRIADYLLTKTTQCLVTSHSPYVIESFEPERTLILRRDDKGTVSGKQITLSADIKAKTYRRHLRRSIAEAMLARGVIVAEGFTEVVTLQAVAAAMEGADAKNYPLDLAGVSIITPDGDGSVPEFGRFFASLDLPVFAFLDKKTRPPKDVAALASAGFTILNETAYPSMEALMVAEIPLNRQWQYLEQIRDSGSAPGVAIPATRPADDQVRAKAKEVLAAGKGWGRSAELIELCAAAELPVSVTGFLAQVYVQFPRPEVKPIEAVNEESTGDDPPKSEGGGADDASPPTEGGGA